MGTTYALSITKYITVKLQGIRSKRRWILGLNIAFPVIFITSLVWQLTTEWENVKIVFFNINPINLFLIFGLYGLTFFLFVLAWSKLVTCFDGPRNLKTNVFFYASSQLAKLIPTPIWFIGTRVYLYNKKGVPKKTTLLITALETLLHFFSGLLILVFLNFNPSQLITWIYLVSIVIIAILILKSKNLIPPSLIPKFKNVPLSAKKLLTWLIIYSFTWIIAAPFFWLIVRIFTPSSTLDYNFLWKIWIISSLISYVSSYTLGGLGMLREVSLTWFLNTIYPIHISLLMATAVRIFMTSGGLIWGAATYLATRNYPNAAETRHS